MQIELDDIGMRQLFPLAALDEMRADMAKVVQHAEDALAPDGIGWMDLHEIPVPTASYRQLGLAADEFLAALAPVLPRIPWVQLGRPSDGQFYTLETDVHCYGLGRELFVKVDVKDGQVDGVWYDVWGRRTDPSPLRPALAAIDAIVPSMLADYRLERAGALSDTVFLDSYLDRLRDSLA